MTEQQRYLDSLLGADRIHITSIPFRAIDYDYVAEDIEEVKNGYALRLRRIRGRSFTTSGVSSLLVKVSELMTGDFQVIPLIEIKPGQFKPVRQ